MIAAALAAQTAATLLHGLVGKHKPSADQGGAGEKFSAQLDALLPSAGTTLSQLGTLGQDLLGTLGIGKAAAAPTQPAAAAQAYAASAARP